MKFLRLLLGRRGAERRGSAPSVEAALRAKRARDHLARKRRHDGRRDGWRDTKATGTDVDAGVAAEPFESLLAGIEPTGGRPAPASTTLHDAPLVSSRPIALPRVSEPEPSNTSEPGARAAAETAPFTLEPPRGAGGPRKSDARPAARQGSSRTPWPAPTPTAATSPTSSIAQAGPTPPTARTPRSSNAPIGRPRPATPRGSSVRAVGPVRALPRLVLPGCTLLALGLGFALGRPLFERFWLPRVPFRRVAVVGASVREPMTIAWALLAQAGAPLDRLTPDGVRAVVLSDPWLASADSLRLPDGTLLLRVRERRAIARYRGSLDEPEALVDPEGHRFLGDVAEGGPLPLIDGAIAGDAQLPPATLEILAELRRHVGLSTDLSALILHLPLANAVDRPEASGASAHATSESSPAAREAEPGDESLAGETGYVLELGEQGPRALLGQTYLKRRVARLASLLEQRDRLLAGARVIDLRYADRAVLRTEPTSG